jgi:DNA-binding CsgD family transcriptional regulator
MLLERMASQLQAHGVAAVVVTGVMCGPDEEHDDHVDVVAAFPSSVAQLKSLFSVRHAPGPDVDERTEPQVSWLDLRTSSIPGRDQLIAQDLHSVIRVRMPVVGRRGFEILLFSRRGIFHHESAALALWLVMGAWPRLKTALAVERCRLTLRERECLSYIFRGLTAAETGAWLHCTERTVRLHLSNASRKLGAKNTAASIRNALMIGAL